MTLSVKSLSPTLPAQLLPQHTTRLSKDLKVLESGKNCAKDIWEGDPHDADCVPDILRQVCERRALARSSADMS